MLRSLSLFAVLCVIAHDARLTEACHAGHSKTESTDDYEYDYKENGESTTAVSENAEQDRTATRAKRQVHQYGDDFEKLREYFRACMMDKVPEQSDWRSIVDFSILKTLWFFYSGTVACSDEGGNDNSTCWKGCIDVYLRSSSPMIEPAKDCVEQYEMDFNTGKAVYTPTFRKVEKPASKSLDKYSECVQAQYNEADPRSLLEDNGILSVSAESELNIDAIISFVRKNVLCTLCDYSPLPSGQSKPNIKEIGSYELVDGSVQYSVTWPFSLEALVRRDARLRLAVSFCNKQLEGTFRRNPPSNPGWTQWFTWANCDATCGSSGYQKRLRVCLNVSQRNCRGPKSESRACHNRNCAHWSNWGQYMPCIATCDISEKYSFRYCVNGNIGEEGCIGERRRSKSCIVSSCQVPWSQWSTCSVTCGAGGVQHRTGGRSLLETKTETKLCMPGACPQQWSPWSPWGPCSKTCGLGGTRQRLRKCISKTPCIGFSLQTVACDQNYLRCQDAWGDWSPWSGCVYRKRSRSCNGLHGTNCPGEKENLQECLASDCKPVNKPASWSPWSAWSRCSATCGRADRRRIRKCTVTNSDFPGACAGGNIEVDKCNSVPCHTEVKPSCSNHRGWEGYCRDVPIDCQSYIGLHLCKNTCGHC